MTPDFLKIYSQPSNSLLATPIVVNVGHLNNYGLLASLIITVCQPGLHFAVDGQRFGYHLVHFSADLHLWCEKSLLKDITNENS